LEAVLHAKTIVVDGVWSTIGSTNFDNRSFALNQEINLTVYNSAIAHRLEQIFEDELKYSQRNLRTVAVPQQPLRVIEMFAFPIREQPKAFGHHCWRVRYWPRLAHQIVSFHHTGQTS